MSLFSQWHREQKGRSSKITHLPLKSLQHPLQQRRKYTLIPLLHKYISISIPLSLHICKYLLYHPFSSYHIISSCIYILCKILSRIRSVNMLIYYYLAYIPRILITPKLVNSPLYFPDSNSLILLQMLSHVGL